MARMDVSTTVNKQRRNVPRILSTNKNSQLSLIDTGYIKDHFEDSEEDHHTSLSSPATEQSEQHEHTDTISIQNTSNTKEDPQIEHAEQGFEIQVNKMITVRQGPQLYVPPRRLRCAPATNATENSDALKTLTPNEILIALVNFFAPPMSGDETPPVLDREFTPSDEQFAVVSQDMSVSDRINALATQESSGVVQESKATQIQSSTSCSLMSNNSTMPDNGPPTGHFPLISSTRPNDSSNTRYPPMTLGGALGIRRSRTVTNHSLNNNLTLDQLNPPLAEALAAMKSKSGVLSKSGNQGSMSSSDGYPNRRDSLPTRMSGPVTLEALATSNSTSTDGGAPTSGHLVSFNGQTTEVPEEIHCHLCDYPMKLCIRKSKYKGEIREYAAYRCLRKGCQTFRSVRKVIEPDFPCPRKRKLEESALEIFDACNASPGSGASSVQQACPDAVNSSEGTLLFIPGKVTTKHLEAMQEFTFNLLGGANGPVETVPRPLFAQVNMNTQDIKNLLRTEEGQKEIQRILMTATQPATPRFILEACDKLQNTCAMAQVTSTNDTPVFVPQLENTANCSSSVPPVQVSQMSCLLNYNQNAAYSGNTLTPLQEFCWPGIPPPTQFGPHPSCGMAAQAVESEIRAPPYASELNW